MNIDNKTIIEKDKYLELIEIREINVDKKYKTIKNNKIESIDQIEKQYGMLTSPQMLILKELRQTYPFLYW